MVTNPILRYSQECLDRSIGLECICQLLRPGDAGHYAEVEVQLRQ